MCQNLEQNVGLRILARIITKAYLAEGRRDNGVTKAQKMFEKDEDASRTSGDNLDGEDDSQLE